MMIGKSRRVKTAVEKIMEKTETNEKYLEEILFIEKVNGRVRAVDISNKMGYSKPTVSVKLKQLASDGYVGFADDESIVLTETGRSIAEKIGERHAVLTKALILLGVGALTAEADACKIEHDLSDETFEIIKKHLSQKS